MENIFASSSVRTYAGGWSVKASRKFNETELAAITSATVVASNFGNSVMFTLVSGRKAYIPVSTQSRAVAEGEVVKPEEATLVTLERAGDADIVRVEF